VLAHLIGDAALNEDPRARHAVLAGKGRDGDGQQRPKPSPAGRRMSSTDTTTPRTTINTVSSSGSETSQRTPHCGGEGQT
jgi:hypothetical protein